jgi:fructose-1,6-bisphosphatase
MRIGAIRVAIRGSIHEAKSLSVERLDRDEPAPAGSIEAMLVLTGPIDGSLEIATNLPVGDIEARPH